MQSRGGRSVAVNTSGCGPEDRGFDSLRPPHSLCFSEDIHAPVAQGTEHLASNQRVGGSNPSGRATQFFELAPRDIPNLLRVRSSIHTPHSTTMDISFGFIAVLAFGFLLGLKHATDADHVVAVANIVDKERNLWQSIWIGASWGAGHSLPLLVLGTIILLVKGVVLDRYESVAPYLELGVAVMLIYLGVSAAWNVLRGKLHIHQHSHGKQPHVHIHASHEPSARHEIDRGSHNSFFILGKPVFRVKSFVIGIVHGLAGSAAVMVALVPTIDAAWVGIGYILLFSVGTMISMAGLTLVLALPFRFSSAKQNLNRYVVLAAGALSIAVGAILIAEITLDTTIMPI